MNDSFRSRHLFVKYDPTKIACGCIFLAARVLQIPTCTNPYWFELFDVEPAEVFQICNHIIEDLRIRAGQNMARFLTQQGFFLKPLFYEFVHPEKIVDPSPQTESQNLSRQLTKREKFADSALTKAKS